MKRWIVVAVLACLTGGLGLLYAGIQSGVVVLNHPDPHRFPVRGIDLSHYQGRVDWNRVRAAGIEFAYIKATEGGDFTDPAFVGLTAGARRAGVRVGLYHYFTFCRDGAAQARHFLEVTGGPTPDDLPPVVDLEFGGNCSRRPTPAEMDREYAAFEAPVRQAFGRGPVLYVTGEFADLYLSGAAGRGSALAGHELWRRDLRSEPAGGCARWTFWQYANRGEIDGVEEPVDLDVYCGDRAAFDRKFARTSGQT